MTDLGFTNALYRSNIAGMGGKAKVDIVVYVARNNHNGKEYIGVSRCGLAKRRREHFFAVRNGSTLKFHNALRKHGQDGFVFSVFEHCDDYQIALARERELIKERSPAYNLNAGGGGNLGFKMPKDAIERMAARKRGKPGYWAGKKRPVETIEKMRAARLANPQRYWLGKRRDETTNEKIRLAKIGVPRKPPPDHALKIFADNMRRAALARRRKVKCLNDGLVFDCAGAAADNYGLKRLSISQVCSGKRNSVYGFRFEYLE